MLSKETLRKFLVPKWSVAEIQGDKVEVDIARLSRLSGLKVDESLVEKLEQEIGFVNQLPDVKVVEIASGEKLKYDDLMKSLDVERDTLGMNGELTKLASKKDGQYYVVYGESK